MKFIKSNSFEKLVEIISAKIDANLSTYLPRVQTLQMDFEDYRVQTDDELNILKKTTNDLRHQGKQLEELKRSLADPNNHITN